MTGSVPKPILREYTPSGIAGMLKSPPKITPSATKSAQSTRRLVLMFFAASFFSRMSVAPFAAILFFFSLLFLSTKKAPPYMAESNRTT
jgi:hypothetical protein